MKHVTDGNFTFQQDGALMLVLLQCKTPIFLSFWAVVPNSPEINSNDDEIYGDTQQQQHDL